jgi:predicted PhzF superfamily epimerase YddE/YHI9
MDSGCRAAAELNQPATAFLHDRRLRWFTPVGELPLCGHATLATAHVLYEAGLVAPADPIVFEAAPGPLGVWCQDGMVWIGFAPVALQEAAAHGAVMEALGLQGGDDADFTSRNFAPALGLDED